MSSSDEFLFTGSKFRLVESLILSGVCSLSTSVHDIFFGIKLWFPFFLTKDSSKKFFRTFKINLND